ncbi:MAG: hypothetical protein ACK53Y_14285, partial [bacterium]
HSRPSIGREGFLGNHADAHTSVVNRCATVEKSDLSPIHPHAERLGVWRNDRRFVVALELIARFAPRCACLDRVAPNDRFKAGELGDGNHGAVDPEFAVA